MLTDSFQAQSRYMETVFRFPKLSRERELALFRRWQTERDEPAKQELVCANLRYVVAIALKYRRYGIPVSELIAEGNLGIVLALAKFDPERQLRFITYACYWIRALILDHVVRSWSLVGAGSGALRSKVFFKLRRERIRITNLVGEGESANRLLAERLNLPRERLTSMLGRLTSRDVSLNSPLFGDASATLVESLVSHQTSPEQAYANARKRHYMRDLVQGALGALDHRERYIVEQRLMSDSEDEKSLAELGRQLGISRERARQLETRAKRKLRTLIFETSGTKSIKGLSLENAA
jgi:RNA polymerase sigma-32 factor